MLKLLFSKLLDNVDKIPIIGSIISVTKSILLIITLSIIAYLTFPYYMTKSTVVHINKTERIVKGDESYYLIFTDQGVFKNEDDWRLFKFNSSDYYAQLNQDKKVILYHYGFRINLLSWYPNIRKYQIVEWKLQPILNKTLGKIKWQIQMKS